MKLVDTSLWIDFLRGRAGAAALADAIREGEVLMHPWVLGELALGNLGPRRKAILADFALLPAAPVVAPEEILAFLEHHDLDGAGIGLVDVQLMASARLIRADLAATDRRLAAAWSRLQGR